MADHVWITRSQDYVDGVVMRTRTWIECGQCGCEAIIAGQCVVINRDASAGDVERLIDG